MTSDDDFEQLDADARRRIGKPLDDCTFDDLQRLIAMNMADVVRDTADVDRADATLAEARVCGCSNIAEPRLDDGSPDIGRVRVVHTCYNCGWS